MAVMMLSPTYADIFHCGRMVPIINPIKPRRARANPKICRPLLAISSSSPSCFSSRKRRPKSSSLLFLDKVRSVSGKVSTSLLWYVCVSLMGRLKNTNCLGESPRTCSSAAPWVGRGAAGASFSRRFLSLSQVGGDAHAVSTHHGVAANTWSFVMSGLPVTENRPPIKSWELHGRTCDFFDALFWCLMVLVCVVFNTLWFRKCPSRNKQISIFKMSSYLI